MKRQHWRRAGVALIGLAVLLAGCKKPWGPPTAATKPLPTQQTAPVVTPGPGGGVVVGTPAAGGGGGGGIDLKRTATKTNAANQLRNIVQYYINYATLNGPPKTVKELVEDFRQQAGMEYQSVQEGYFIIVPNVQPSGNVVLAYEQNADSSGIHFVGLGDGSVQKMTTQQLKAALQMK